MKDPSSATAAPYTGNSVSSLCICVKALNTEKLFSTPEDQRTEDYITGRFG